MVRKLLVSVAVLFLATLLPGEARAASSAIVLNEILANAQEEYTGEFVELYNIGSTAVDVGGWTIKDINDTDSITDFTGANDWGTSGTFIPGGGYAVVVDPSYTGQYNAYLNANADPNKVVMLTTDDSAIGDGLKNEGDTVTVSDGAGYLASFSWTSDAGESISWEKKDPTGGDGSSNWAECTGSYGSTPGVQNSVYTPTAVVLSSFSARGTLPTQWVLLPLLSGILAGLAAVVAKWYRFLR